VWGGWTVRCIITLTAMRVLYEEMKIVALTHNEGNDTYCTVEICRFGEGS